MSLHLALVFSLFFAYIQGEFIYADSDLGILNGTIMTTRNGRDISSFLGIPYAKPPVGSLRFKNPERMERWDDILSASTDANKCPQLNDDGVAVGDEDCLYLNVYSPDIYPDERYATMVYFHGGDFVRGSASSKDVGPQYLLDRDIVLVTVNYRLGVLGFLSTGDAEAPGNFGLWDQVAALRWVQENIMYFGGDPNLVTIFGNGAGGASTAMHMVSSASNGLFHRFISQSGTAMPAFWAYHEFDEYYKRYVNDLGKYLNCSTDNSKVLINCLREIDSFSLVDTNRVFNQHGFINIWIPTSVPGRTTGAFLDFPPATNMFLEQTKDIPAILGDVADGIPILTTEFRLDNTMYDSFVKDLDAFLLSMTKISYTDVNPFKCAENIKKFYLNNTESSDNETIIQDLEKFLVDVIFIFPTHFQATTIGGYMKSPIYKYSFDYRGTVTAGSNIDGSYGDDLIYLFPMNPDHKDSSNLQLSESDEKMIDIMIDFWTSFAYTGIPISKSTSDTWEPFKIEEENYLKIGNNSSPTLSTEYGYKFERIRFWYDQFAGQFEEIFRLNKR